MTEFFWHWLKALMMLEESSCPPPRALTWQVFLVARFCIVLSQETSVGHDVDGGENEAGTVKAEAASTRRDRCMTAALCGGRDVGGERRTRGHLGRDSAGSLFYTCAKLVFPVLNTCASRRLADRRMLGGGVSSFPARWKLCQIRETPSREREGGPSSLGNAV